MSHNIFRGLLSGTGGGGGGGGILTGGVSDDEFNGSGALSSPWVSYNTPTSATQNGSGSLVITSASSGIANNPCGVEQPVSGDFAFETKIVGGTPGSNGEMMGFLLRESATGKRIIFGPGKGTATEFKVQASDGQRWQQAGATLSTYDCLLRVQRVGSILGCYYSLDSGSTWPLLYENAETTNFTTAVNRIGLFAAGPISGSISASFDYLRAKTAIAAEAAAGSHTYWAINVATNTFGAGIMTIAELMMRLTPGGTNQCSGGTPSSSNANGSFPVTNAFDGNTTTFFGSGGDPCRVVYQFASAKAIREIAIQGRDSAQDTQSPGPFDIQYSDNGSTWTTVRSIGNGTWGTASIIKPYLVPQ